MPADQLRIFPMRRHGMRSITMERVCGGRVAPGQSVRPGPAEWRDPSRDGTLRCRLPRRAWSPAAGMRRACRTVASSSRSAPARHPALRLGPAHLDDGAQRIVVLDSDGICPPCPVRGRCGRCARPGPDRQSAARAAPSRAGQRRQHGVRGPRRAHRQVERAAEDRHRRLFGSGPDHRPVGRGEGEPDPWPAGNTTPASLSWMRTW